MKISKLKNLLSNARLVDESQLDTTKALILSIVTIENTANGMKMTYTLVAENEQDLKAKKNKCRITYWSRPTWEISWRYS
jgi:transcription elongation factor GreA